MDKKYDFGGYATKNDLRCSDGRTIKSGAFKHQDGQKVPLVWHHRGEESPSNIMGHAYLENREDGVYAYCSFNNTRGGQDAKEAVKHGDVASLSIYANKLVERGKDVLHGFIKEVSIVMAGANPGAMIDNVIFHSDGDDYVVEDEAIIYTDSPISMADDEIVHEDTAVVEETSDERTIEDILKTFNEEQMNVLTYMLEAVAEADSSDEPDEEDQADDDESDAAHSDDSTENNNEIQHQEGTDMDHNVFEGDSKRDNKRTLTHAEIDGIFTDAKRLGSMKEAVEGFALKHGIEQIDILFPDAKAISETPELFNLRTEWVSAVMGAVRHTPFSRIKTLVADITMDEARAKGYIKGNFKKEEFFKILKRTTTPQTVYKKQKLDRDDILDITSFDVVAWLKAEMRLKMEEELARAILIGDGRSNGDDDKIKEDHVRPVAMDDEFYQTTVYVNLDDANSSAEEIVDALTLHRRHYRGSGNPTFFTSETILARLLLIKDDIGRRIYPNVTDLAAALRVRAIVAIEHFDELESDLVGIMVNLADYNVGTDRGGAVTLFDDFDIDYNQYKYLIETRFSGALVRPKSALIVRKVAGSSVLVVPVAPTRVGNVVTVATTTGVVYKNKANGATLVTASPTTLTEGQVLTVVATPASGYYFATSADDEWTFEGTAE